MNLSTEHRLARLRRLKAELYEKLKINLKSSSVSRGATKGYRDNLSKDIMAIEDHISSILNTSE